MTAGQASRLSHVGWEYAPSRAFSGKQNVFCRRIWNEGRGKLQIEDFRLQIFVKPGPYNLNTFANV